MINAGAIITCSLLKTLIKPEMTLAEKFDYTLSYFRVCETVFDSNFTSLQSLNNKINNQTF